MRLIQTIIELVTSLWRPTPPPTDAMPTPPLPGGRPPVPSTDTDKETEDGTDEGGERQDPAASPGGKTPWLTLARREDGTREIAGPDHNSRIVKYYADAGHPEIIDDETAWCAAFVGAMLERAGVRSTRSLMARSYLQWGKKLNGPEIGAIGISSRGDDPRFGHVWFCVGWTDRHVLALGGNQWNPSTKRSEIVNVSKIPHEKVLGYRWPVTMANSRTVQGVTTSGTGLTMQQSASMIPDQTPQQLQDAGTQLQLLGHVKWWLGAIGTLLVIVGICWVLYARIDDIRNKGR